MCSKEKDNNRKKAGSSASDIYVAELNTRPARGLVCDADADEPPVGVGAREEDDAESSRANATPAKVVLLPLELLRELNPPPVAVPLRIWPSLLMSPARPAFLTVFHPSTPPALDEFVPCP